MFGTKTKNEFRHGLLTHGKKRYNTKKVVVADSGSHDPPISRKSITIIPVTQAQFQGKRKGPTSLHCIIWRSNSFVAIFVVCHWTSLSRTSTIRVRFFKKVLKLFDCTRTRTREPGHRSGVVEGLFVPPRGNYSSCCLCKRALEAAWIALFGEVVT